MIIFAVLGGLIATVAAGYQPLNKIDPEMLSAKYREEYGVAHKAQSGIPFNKMLKDHLNVKYTSCKDAWEDIFYWTALLYGDWYGNNGAHTLMYFFFQYLWVRSTEWITLCINKGEPWSITF